MTENQWKAELKKYLYLLPSKEEKDIMSYYNEVFADYYEQGYTEDEVTIELGNPKDVAKAMVADYMDDDEAINTKEKSENDKKTSTEKAHDIGLKVRGGFTKAGSCVSSFFDGLTADTRKKKSSLSSSEREEYEDEIEKHRREEAQRRAKRRDEEGESIERRNGRMSKKERLEAIRRNSEERRRRDQERRERKTSTATFVPVDVEEDNYERDDRRSDIEKEKGKMASSTKYYEIDDDYEDERTYVRKERNIKKKTYTQAQRHSFLTNFFYVLFMIIFLAIGAALAASGIVGIYMAILSTVQYVDIGVAVGVQLIVDVGYIVLVYGCALLVFGLGLGIFVGVIRKIHKRFFVKKYIMLKKAD